MQRHHLRTRRKDKTATKKVCVDCHKTIHGLFAQSELRDPGLGLDTVEGLLENERLQKAVAYIAKQPAGSFMRMKESRHRRRKRGRRR